MPVDLSMVGLDGLKAYQDRMESISREKVNTAAARQSNYETTISEQEDEVGRIAAERLRQLSSGEKTGSNVVDPEGGYGSNADPMELIGHTYLEFGMVEKGKEMLAESSKIRKREHDIKVGASSDQQRRLKNVQIGAEIVGTQLGGAKNEDEWQLGISRLRSAVEDGTMVMEPELLEQISQMPYDPDVAAYFADQAIKAKDKAKLEMESLRYDQVERSNALRFANEGTRIRLQAARDAQQRRHQDWIEKNGGKDAPSAAAPTGPEVTGAKAYLMNGEMRGVKKGPQLDDAASYVASLAKQIVKDNKAITYDAALGQATQLAKQAGMFEVPLEDVTTVPILDIELSRTPSKKTAKGFKRKGTGPDNAILATPTTKPIKGMWYRNAAGDVDQYVGD